MKTIAEQLNVKEFPLYIKDKNGNESYCEDENGYWIKTEYDSKGNRIYCEDSTGFWFKTEYDSKGNEIYWEDNTGDWIKTEYDSKGNEIYREDSTGYKSDKRVIELTLDQIAEKFGIEVSQLKIKK